MALTRRSASCPLGDPCSAVLLFVPVLILDKHSSRPPLPPLLSSPPFPCLLLRTDAAMASWMNPPVIYPPLLAKGLSALLSARPPALTHPARARVYVEGLISVSCRPCCGTPSLPPCGSPSLSSSVWISLSPKRAHKRQRQ